MNDKVNLTDRQQAIYDMICTNRTLSVEQVMTVFGISRATVFREYNKIKQVTGANFSKKTGTWTLG